MALYCMLATPPNFSTTLQNSIVHKVPSV